MRPFESDAKKIVQHVLESDVPAPTRACSQCEQEHGILRRDDPNKSHGLCKRHTILWAREGGLSDADIQDILQSTDTGKGFVPDLGPVPGLREDRISMCAWCKRIENPTTGQWEAMALADPKSVSHGICPECRQKWVGELNARKSLAPEQNLRT